MADEPVIGLPSLRFESYLSDRLINGTGDDKKKVAQNFEAYMIFTMLKELGKTTEFAKKSFMEETYMSVLYEKIGEFAAQKGLGIKEFILKFLTRDDLKL